MLRRLIPLLVLGVLNLNVVYAAEPETKLVAEARETVESFKRADSTLGTFFSDALAYAVFPKVAKGGFVFGGAHGEGVLFEQGKPVGKVKLTQATFGAQVGGQVFREVIFFQSAPALSRFKEGTFEMSAQAGAVAAAEGVGKTAKYTDGVLITTLPVKGLMVEASVGGQKFDFEAWP